MSEKVDELTFDTMPNRLTVLRMLAVPLVVWLLSFHELKWDIIAALIFIAAAITDFFDGYLARQMKSVTIYGKLLDPLADKFLVVVTLVMLQHLGRVEPWIVMILICREMTISSLRALASAEGVIIAAGSGGKWKAAAQMVGLPFLIVDVDLFGLPLHTIGMVLIYISIVLSISSLATYVFGFFKGLIQKRRSGAAEK